jgi:hypothetical protein
MIVSNQLYLSQASQGTEHREEEKILSSASPSFPSPSSMNESHSFWHKSSIDISITN